jgi:hypothetical protein
MDKTYKSLLINNVYLLDVAPSGEEIISSPPKGCTLKNVKDSNSVDSVMFESNMNTLGQNEILEEVNSNSDGRRMYGSRMNTLSQSESPEGGKIEGLDSSQIIKLKMMKSVTTIKHHADRRSTNSNCYINIELSKEDLQLKENMKEYYEGYDFQRNEEDQEEIIEISPYPNEAVHMIILARIMRKYCLKLTFTSDTNVLVFRYV